MTIPEQLSPCQGCLERELTRKGLDGIIYHYRKPRGRELVDDPHRDILIGLCETALYLRPSSYHAATPEDGI